MQERWGDVLAPSRQALFVGREAESSELDAFFDATGPRALHLCGPPGVGKSTLLAHCLQRARARGRRVLQLDGRWLSPTPAALHDALNQAGDLEALDALAIDTFEHLAPLEGWLRDVLLPTLPARVGLITAGREPLSAAWHVDPGLRSLLRVVPLRNLPLDASLCYLERAGVASAQRRGIAASTHGHPLSLALAAELGRNARSPAARSAASGSLVDLLLAGTTADDRRVLLAGSLCRSITEPLFARLFDGASTDEVAGMLDWLRARPFVERGERGLVFHELARDHLLGELRARNPELYDTLVDRLVAGCIEQLSRGPTTEEPLLALFHALRAEPGGQALRMGQVAAHYADSLERTDHAAVVAAMERHEGAASARIAEHWLRHRPRGWLALRGPDRGLAGFAFFLETSSTSDADADADPLLRVFLDALAERQPLRASESALLCRHWMSVAEHQATGPVQAVLFLQLTLRLALTPGVAVGASVHARPREWAARGDATHELIATTALDGLELGIFGHDWRREPPLQWLERMVALLRHGPASATAAASAAPEPILLDRHEFERAARRALRDLQRGDRLAKNPLCSSPLVLRRSTRPADPEQAAAILRQLLEQACRDLGDTDGDHHHMRVLEHEFLLPRKKQLASAAALGLGYSTYRRDLSIALERVLGRLWKAEIGAALDAGTDGG